MNSRFPHRKQAEEYSFAYNAHFAILHHLQLHITKSDKPSISRCPVAEQSLQDSRTALALQCEV